MLEGAVVEFGLLGPLRVRDGETPVIVSARHQRVLLAALLLKAGRQVPADELIEVMWDDRPPRGAKSALHSAIHRLRSALGPAAGETILTRPSGYVIDIADEQLDVRMAGVLTARGQAAAAARRWEDADAAYGEALRLWRGEPLADVPSPLLHAREVPHLAEQRLQVISARFDACLRLGRHQEIVTDLRRLVIAHPLREGLHAQLMLALYRSGRQAEALAAYHDVRRVLDAELGVRPGPDLQRLHQRMLQADSLLLRDAQEEPDSAPRIVRGPERPVPGQLPAAIRHFTGRAGELTALASMLPAKTTSHGPAVIAAITGTPGVGKSALAVHFAHKVTDRFPDGQLYVNLRGFDASGSPLPAAEAVRGFLDAFAVQAHMIPAAFEAQIALYRSMLTGRRVLVVLDNARDAEQVRPLLPGSPTCMTIVTSRRQLTSLVAAEGAFLLTLDFLTTDEARDLLRLILGPHRLTSEPRAADELIAQCARLPLALSIAAARAAARSWLPLSAMADQLRSAQARLSALDAGDGAANVRAAFSWSYESLNGPAALMFAMLSLHPGPDIAAATAASLAGCPPQQASLALSELCHAQLLTEHLPGRFTFHDLLRAYAAERMAGDDNAAARRAAIRRLLDHYLHTAHTAVLLMEPTRQPLGLAAAQPGVTPETIGGPGQALAWFEAEYPAVLAIIRQSADMGFEVHAWQLSSTVARFFDGGAYWREWVQAATIAMSAAERLGDPTARADAHHRLGCALATVGAHGEAEKLMLRAAGIYRKTGDITGQANIHISLCAMIGDEGRYRTALRHARRALSLARAADSRPYTALALNAVGWYLAMLGDFRPALTYCENAVDLHRELGNRIGEANTWDSLGYVHHHLNQFARAVTCYRRASDLRGELGQRHPQARTLVRLGEVYAAAGSTQAARDVWEQALGILSDMDHPVADQVRGSLSRLRGRSAEAGR